MKDPTLRFIAFCSAALAVLTGLVLFQLYTKRGESLNLLRLALKGYSQVTEEALGASLDRIDNTLYNLTLQFRENPNLFNKTILRRTLDDHVLPLREIKGLFVVRSTENGEIVGSSTTAGEQKFNRNANIANRDYFKILQAEDLKSPILTEPIVGRFSGNRVVLLVRRLNDARGKFSGVVLASIPDTFFADFRRRSEMSRFDLFNVATGKNLQKLIRFPESNHPNDQPNNIEHIDKSLLESTERIAEIKEFISPVDGIRRMVSMTRLQKYPLVFAIGQSLDIHLSPWRGEVYVNIVLLVLCLGLFYLVLFNYFSYYKNSNKIILQKNIELSIANENAFSASRMKSEFLANMSHEIRTPLNAIIGITELISTSKIDEEQRSLFESVKSSGKILLNLINDILDFSKIEAGRVEIEKVDFEVRELLTHLRNTFQTVAENKNVLLEFDLPPTEIWLKGDSGRVAQILTNLIGNAIKFTEVGKVSLSLVTQIDDNAKIQCRFTVRDTGIGIPESAKPLIFGDFAQAEASTTRKYGGTGLGLAISKKLAGLMGGSISFESQEGTGSTFTVDLPFEKGVEQLNQKSNSSEIPTKFNASILVAEDNRVNQVVIVKMLESLGCKVQIVKTGSEVLTTISRERFDLILMDCQMPEMDGFDATRKIRENSNIEFQRIPIIALTAHAFPEERQRCIDSGMNDFLTKPITISLLAKTLQKYLN